MNNYSDTSQTHIALSIYDLSSKSTNPDLIDAVLWIKIACAQKNQSLGYLEKKEADAIIKAAEYFLELSENERRDWFSLDAYQGGAGTSTNMMVNEAIASHAHKAGIELSPLGHVNLHTSTNDVMPTALKLALFKKFEMLENLMADLQMASQVIEKNWEHMSILAHTELQDAIPMKASRIASTWAASLARDRWRLMKSRERIKEVNLGGTAIGTGAGAPKAFAMGIITELRNLTKVPLARAEDAVEATSNYDTLVEAMSSVQIAAISLIRIANDIRLYSSGPIAGFGLFRLPRLLKGSTIMPGKINPVIAEMCIQTGERILSNHAQISHFAARSEMQLNAFFPYIAELCFESCQLLQGSAQAMKSYIEKIEINEEIARNQLEKSYSAMLSLTPLFGYKGVESLVHKAQMLGKGLNDFIEQSKIFSKDDFDFLCNPHNIHSFGYNEDDYNRLKEKYSDKIVLFLETL